MLLSRYDHVKPADRDGAPSTSSRPGPPPRTAPAPMGGDRAEESQALSDKLQRIKLTATHQAVALGVEEEARSKATARIVPAPLPDPRPYRLQPAPEDVERLAADGPSAGAWLPLPVGERPSPAHGQTGPSVHWSNRMGPFVALLQGTRRRRAGYRGSRCRRFPHARSPSACTGWSTGAARMATSADVSMGGSAAAACATASTPSARRRTSSTSPSARAGSSGRSPGRGAPSSSAASGAHLADLAAPLLLLLLLLPLPLLLLRPPRPAGPNHLCCCCCCRCLFCCCCCRCFFFCCCRLDLPARITSAAAVVATVPPFSSCCSLEPVLEKPGGKFGLLPSCDHCESKGTRRWLPRPHRKLAPLGLCPSQRTGSPSGPIKWRLSDPLPVSPVCFPRQPLSVPNSSSSSSFSAFCLDCIRNWRKKFGEGLDVDGALRSCPVCRQTSWWVLTAKPRTRQPCPKVPRHPFFLGGGTSLPHPQSQALLRALTNHAAQVCGAQHVLAAVP